MKYNLHSKDYMEDCGSVINEILLDLALTLQSSLLDYLCHSWGRSLNYDILC
jgi:hypothetical protein